MSIAVARTSGGIAVLEKRGGEARSLYPLPHLYRAVGENRLPLREAFDHGHLRLELVHSRFPSGCLVDMGGIACVGEMPREDFAEGAALLDRYQEEFFSDTLARYDRMVRDCYLARAVHETPYLGGFMLEFGMGESELERLKRRGTPPFGIRMRAIVKRMDREIRRIETPRFLDEWLARKFRI